MKHEWPAVLQVSTCAISNYTLRKPSPPRASDKTPVHRKGPLGYRKCAALKIMSSKYEKLVRYVKSYQARKLLTLN